MCVPDVAKNMNAKVFNLMSRTNKTRHIKSHEICKCKCTLDASVCNSKQRWDNDKFRCECKELIDKGACDKGVIWNPSNCECEFNKLCDVGEYLDYTNCKCRKRLIDKLLKECNENINEKELKSDEIISVTSNDYKNMCGSCERSSYTIYIVLLAAFSIISISISCVFGYFHWYLKKEQCWCY